MDDRKAQVLRAIVEQYIETAQPVGSQSIARSAELGVSSATVRNEMTVLEREGYIAQPHTSAGRIPTDKGYRYFVDHLGRLDTSNLQWAAVTDFFRSAHVALEDVLRQTSTLLSELTTHAAVVVGPQPGRAVVRSVQLVALHPDTLLLVVVMSNAAVEREVLHLAAPVDEAHLGPATAVVAAALRDRHLGDRVEVAPSPGRPEVDELVRLTLERFAALGDRPAEPLYVGGASRIAAGQDDFTATRTVADLLQLLERQYLVVTLVRDLLDQGLTVRIGAENDLTELRECAVVLAPYTIDGEPAGTVGVLGPTRMNYRQAMAAVAVVSQQLGRHLS
jgi:heat-inducible transcriptional repressor